MAINTSSIAYNVFRKHYGSLEQAIVSSETLAGHLFSDELISAGTKDEVNSSNSSQLKKAAWLLDAVQKTLATSSEPEKVFNRLCDVLELSGETALRDIAGRMRSSLSGTVKVVYELLH